MEDNQNLAKQQDCKGKSTTALDILKPLGTCYIISFLLAFACILVSLLLYFDWNLVASFLVFTAVITVPALILDAIAFGLARIFGRTFSRETLLTNFAILSICCGAAHVQVSLVYNSESLAILGELLIGFAILCGIILLVCHMMCIMVQDLGTSSDRT